VPDDLPTHTIKIVRVTANNGEMGSVDKQMGQPLTNCQRTKVYNAVVRLFLVAPK